MKWIVLTLLYVVYCLPAAAQQTDDQLLQDYGITQKNASSSLGGTFYIARFNKNNTTVKSTNGFTVARRLSVKLAIVRVLNKEVFNGERNRYFDMLQPANNNWKLSPKLLRNEARHGKWLITLFDSSAELPALKNLQAVYRYHNNYIITGDEQFILKQVLPDDRVIFIDAVTAPKTEMVLNGVDLTANKVTSAHDVYPGINGNGLTVSVKENLFDTADIDFAQRYVAGSVASSIMESHATIMATVIGGAGNSYYTGRGVARNSKLTSSDFANLLPDADYMSNSITVQNHSYGTGIENYYGADAAAYDESAVNNPSLLHVFSSGNSGDKTSDTGNYKGVEGYANITGSFKMAKNIVTVGSIDSFYHPLPLSSRGPAYDGRIKPELVAYGTDGSSGAAAIVSGTALLVQQAYKESTNALPPASLVKAILLNSADDVGTKGIDYTTGFGSMNALRALREVSAKHWLIDSLEQSGERKYLIHVPANAKLFKVLLCWTDAPAAVNSYRALVNDLDLELTNTVTGTKFLPYILSSFPDKDSLKQQAKQQRDSLNNAEQAIIENVPEADYMVKVKGYTVDGGLQPYALAWQWDTLRQFNWLYPTKADNLYAGESAAFRWESTYPAGQNTLEISYNKGQSWVVLNNQVNNTAGYYTSTVKDSFCLGMLRMQVAGQHFYSDTFTISKRLATGVGYNCADSFLLYWQKAPGITQYAVYDVRQSYLEKNRTIPDTSVVLSKEDNPVYFAVAPVIGERPGLKSYGFNYTTQGITCYIKTFLADLLPPDKATLHIELGSTIGIQSILIQQLTSLQPIIIQTITNITGLSYTVTIDSLSRGLNNYRLQIVLTNGRTIYSDIQTVNYLGKDDFVVFPNPAVSGQSIKMLTRDLNEYVFTVYSSLGQQVLQANIADLYTEIPAGFLARGIYFYIIRQNGKIVHRGKLLMQ